MPLKSIILMRHAEREDRASEAKGIDWISTAERPQDPLLSELGIQQAIEVGRQLKDVGVTKILSSPMIRTVMTADAIAEQLGMGEKTINVEMGLVEESKSFRGKTDNEPRPNWNPLILPPHELSKYSNRLNLDYKTLVDVQHVRDESRPNTVREVHDTLTDKDEVTKDRCAKAWKTFLETDILDNEVVLCVGHGATVKGFMFALQADLPEEFHITGDRSVSCFAEFRPVDPTNPHGPWKSVTGSWSSGNIFTPAAEDMADRG